MAPCRPRAGILAIVLCVALCAPAYAAGILCGTVRDAVTGNPIVGAGIFLRQTTGQYTGFNGATDATGHPIRASRSPSAFLATAAAAGSIRSHSFRRRPARPEALRTR